MDDSKKSLHDRRDFLKSSAVVGALGLLVPAAGQAAPHKSAGGNVLNYPQTLAGTYSHLETAGHLSFNYPDKNSPCLLIKTGKECRHGIGPERDVVAYSILCSHQGCPVNYVASAKVFRCSCHFTQYDGEKAGQMITGQATRNLARIELAMDDKSGKIFATGVDGLIYGRPANVF